MEISKTTKTLEIVPREIWDQIYEPLSRHDQAKIIRRKHDLYVLDRVLPRFPNLTRFTAAVEPEVAARARPLDFVDKDRHVSNNSNNNNKVTNLRTPAVNLLLSPTFRTQWVEKGNRYRELEGYRITQVLMQNIVAHSIRPDSFCLGYVHPWSIDRRCSDIGRLPPLLSNIKRFEADIADTFALGSHNIPVKFREDR